MKNHNSFATGFSLIELMIALAIVGILSAIAYPAYVTYIEKGKRTECRAGLLKSMQQEERYFTQYNTYATFTAGTATAVISSYSGDSLAQSACLIAATACGSNALSQCVELQATPNSYADSKISELELDSQSNKTCILKGTTSKIIDISVCWP
jgi:type IV pilus assembly protein PilE